MAMGWTWGEVDELTIPQVRAIHGAWTRFPPAHRLLAAQVGFKPEKVASRPSSEVEVLSFVNAFNGV